MDHVIEFIGRLHPAIVHLPIGVLILFSILVWMRKRFNIAHQHLILILGIGAITAVLSVVTGLILSRNEEYDPDTLGFHKWMGITTTVVSTLCWFASRKTNRVEEMLKLASGLMLLLVIVTGHIGNDLVRGSSYLVEPFTDSGGMDAQSVFAGNVNDALIYADIIQPILKSKCYNCHGEEKQKGKLRLDQPEFILKGGKHGEVITPGSTSDSDLIMRINLPQDDDDHMPPKERKQLTTKEIAWITAWVEQGADFNKTVKEVVAPDALSMLTSSSIDPTEDYTDLDVAEPDAALISALTEQGVAVTPIADKSRLLQVNMVSVPGTVDSLLERVASLGNNVVSLKLGGTHLTDKGAISLAEFPNLRWLSLNETKISDATLEYIARLTHLKHLNVNGTAVTASGLRELEELKELRLLFLYHTSVTPDEVKQLQILLPNTNIELGGYQVPMLPTDTVVLKPKGE